jgi:hypothetical protein
MAKFSQNTLNQVGGFDGQVLAQELVYNQKAFWNLSWANIISYPSGWQTNTTPVVLTGATITASILRRSLTNFRDSRTGLDFVIRDYPLVSEITTITQSATSTNTFTCTSTDELFIGMPVQFKGTVFGGVAINTTYYVKEVITSTTFTISATRGAAPDYTPGSAVALSSATGTMTMHRVEPLPITLTISNRDDTAGTFTLVIDEETWGVIGRDALAVTYSGEPGDPDLNINATDPACFTGRIKISFPAVGSTPAYDNIVFLLFLVSSDGVYN